MANTASPHLMPSPAAPDEPPGAALRPRDGALVPGGHVGRFRVLRLLGMGGMAEVFLARADDGRLVAIKHLQPSLLGHAEFAEMFFDEARLSVALRHPNIVRTVSVEEHGHELMLVMEFLWGESLGEVIQRSRLERRPVPLGMALEIAQGMCAGLHYAHTLNGEGGRPLGLVHRDISPQNTIVTYDGHVKLIDFGIARSEQRGTRTRTGTLKGKVAYMSPEQCTGAAFDHRADIFALGVVLYELTVGTKLFQGRTEFEVMRAVVEQPITPPSQLQPGYDPGLEAVLMRALARDPAQRYQSASEMGGAIAEVVRRHALVLTSRDIRNFMRVYFSDRWEAWTSARDGGASFADFIAAAAAPGGPSLRERQQLPAASGAELTVEGWSRQPPRSARFHGVTESVTPVRGSSVQVLLSADLDVAARAAAQEVAPRRPPATMRVAPGEGPRSRAGDDWRGVTATVPRLQPMLARPSLPTPSTLNNLRDVVGGLPTSASLRAVVGRTQARRRDARLAAALVLGALLGGGGFVAGTRRQAPQSLVGAESTRPRALPVAKLRPEPAVPVTVKTPAPARPVVGGPLAPGASPSPAPPAPPAPPLGALRLKTRPRCKVSVDGAPAGLTPVTIGLPPGPHQLRLTSAASRLTIERTILIRPGRTLRERFAFRR